MAFRTGKPSNQVAPSPELQQNSSPKPQLPSRWFLYPLQHPQILERIAPDQTGIDPELGLLLAVFDHCNLSPKLLHSVFRWAEKKPGFQSFAELFHSMENLLGKA